MSFALPEALSFTGIDRAAETHAVCVMHAAGKIAAEFTIEHSADGIATLIRRLARHGLAGGMPVAIERPDGRLAATSQPPQTRSRHPASLANRSHVGPTPTTYSHSHGGSQNAIDMTPTQRGQERRDSRRRWRACRPILGVHPHRAIDH